MYDIQVAIVAGFHLFPFRTEKLSPFTPMVLRKWESRSLPFSETLQVIKIWSVSFYSISSGFGVIPIGRFENRQRPGVAFFSLLRKRATFHSAWRPSGTAVSLQAFARPKCFLSACAIGVCPLLSRVKVSDNCYIIHVPKGTDPNCT